MNQKEIQKISISCLLAIATLIIVIFFGKNQLLSVLLLGGISFLMLRLEWNLKYFLLFAVVAISGPLAEAIAIYFKLWTYQNPIFIGIPTWLPFLWGNAALHISRIKAAIDSFK